LEPLLVQARWRGGLAILPGIEIRGILAPGITAAGHLVTNLEKGIHISAVKLRGGFGDEIPRDEGQVVIKIVPLGISIQAEQIADAILSFG
jgi:hypothetical protein